MAVKREKVVQTAEKYVQRGKLSAAIREYRKVLDEFPDDATTLNRLGDLYARQENIPEAIKLFTQIAESYTSDGFFPKATAIYKKIIKLDPTRLEVYEQLAELYHRQGLLNEARTQYQVLGDYYLKHDNTTSATAIYERMTEVDPDDPSLRVKLADLYREQRLLDKAMDQYRRIADLMLAHGHPGDAEQVLLKALEVDASDIGFITDAVMKLKESGEVAAAARFLAAAVEENPEAEKVARMVGMEKGAEAEDQDQDQDEDADADEYEGEGEHEGDDRAVAGGEPPVAAAPGLESADPVIELTPDPEAGDDGEAEVVLDLDDEGGDDLEAAVEAAEEALSGSSEVEPTPAARAMAGLDGTETGEITLDLDDFGQLDFEGDLDEDLEEGLPDDGIDADFLERTAAELDTETVQREEDLVTEAEVLLKYGLTEKAMERLGELMQLNPEHPAGLGLLVRLHLDEEQYEGAAELATRLSQLASGSSAWQELWPKLDASGFERTQEGEIRVPEGVVKEAPFADVIDDAEQQELEEEALAALDLAEDLETEVSEVEIGDTEIDDTEIDDAGTGEAEIGDSETGDAGGLEEGSSEPALEVELGPTIEITGDREMEAEERVEMVPDRPAAKRPASVEERLASLAAEVLPQRRRKKPPAEAEPTASPPVAAEPAPSPPPAREAAEPPPAESPPAEPTPAEPGTEWLQDGTVSEVTPEEGQAAFSDEEDFFDLAAELEEELTEEGELTGDDDLLLQQPKEQSLEEIVEGFKQGVAESLSEEDFTTHYDLGIAYREMGLLDEAVGEFQVAAKSPDLLVECCSMLGLSFLEKGLPELAVKWYGRGLEAPDLDEDDQLGLLYDLGSAYQAMGEKEEAHRVFVDLYGVNSNYRDVVAKLEETKVR